MTDALGRALAALEKMKARIEDLERSRHEPIAVVGAGCRFPGGVVDRASFWRLLEGGVDAVREVPPDRWRLEDFYDPDPEAPGKMYTRSGAFLDGPVDRFDAAFFGVSPREAVQMDPQQRLLLEVAWEALEDALVPPDALAGSATGVFVGFFAFDYYNRMVKAGESAIDAYTGTGNTASVAAGRISYVLGLEGPSVAIDTACSSSLVAIHLACQSLRAGECDLALAAGVNLILTPDRTVYFCKLRAMSRDGRCKAFDASADGYGRGEGCAVVALKRLSRALDDGDRILAVVRGSAVNQDGRSNGLTAPSGPAQEAVVRRALRAAGLEPHAIGYVETHGSGTPLGDPIEARALGRVFGPGRAADRPLAIGAVKSNFGHTEAAAGVAGFLKAVLAVGHGVVPPHLHFRSPSPEIPWAELPLVVPTRPSPWPASFERPVAGVSSFGFSGTNAHVVVEAPPSPPAASARPGPTVLAVSARSREALRALAGAYARRLEGGADPGQVAAAAALGRTHHEHRVAVAGRTATELAVRLAAREPRHVPRGVRRRLVMVFPGQGSQWRGMGRQLLETEPAFRDAIAACDRALLPVVGWSVLDRLAAGDAFDSIDRLQPALWAIEVALAALWRSWGVVPDAVVGHSMGEVAAAAVAGALLLEDAAAVIGKRSRLLLDVAGRGAMALVDLAREDAERALAGLEDRLAVAAVSGPRSTVLSGDAAAIDEVVSRLEAGGVFARRIQVDVASHSPHVDPLAGPLLSALAPISPRPPSIPFHSTVTGRRIEDAMPGAAYWIDNLRRPVLFWPAIDALAREGFDVFLEVSPHPILLPSIEDGLAGSGRDASAHASLRREADERESMLETLGALHERGVPVLWKSVFPGPRPAVDLPAYPWQGERHRLDLGPARPAAGEVLAAGAPAWLGDHRLHGTVVVPGAYAIAAALAEAPAAALEGFAFARPLVLSEGDPGRAVQALVEDGGAFRFLSRGEAGEPWTVHVEGRVAPAAQGIAAAEPLDAIRARCPEAVSSEDFYREMTRRGYAFGPRFRTILSIGRGGEEAVGRVELGGASEGRTVAALDVCLQFPAATFPPGDLETVLAPVGFERLVVAADPTLARWVHARRRGESIDVRLLDEAGAPLVEMTGLEARPLAASAFAVPRARTYALAWRERPLPAATASDASGPVLVVADRGGAGEALARRLGERAALLPPGAGVPDRAWTEVVHLGGLDAEGGAESLLALIRALSDRAQVSPRLLVATRGAESAGDDAVVPAAAPLAGLVRTLALEHPAWRPTLVDLDPADPLPDATLERELAAGDAGEVLWRGGRRLVPRLVAAPLPPASFRFPGDRSILLTGGLGGIALAMARWMAGRGARHLALASRRPPGPEHEAALADLEATGARVRHVAVDVADFEALRGALGSIDPPLAGVVHGAAVLDDVVLATLDEARYARVLAPKALGARNLDRLTRDVPLDFFVLMSSAASILGAPSQGAYAAASAYLDLLAERRRRLGLPATSVAWGPWAEIGLAAARADRSQRLAERGMGSLVPAEAFAILERILAARPAPARVAVLDLDPAAWLAAAGPDRRGLLDELAGTPPPAAAAPPAGLAVALASAAPADRRRLLEEHLGGELARTLRSAAGSIDPRRPFVELGLDSLMALELRNRLERALGLSLPATLAFRHPTLVDLAGHLVERLGLPAGAPRPSIADLSEAEVEAMLLARLERHGK